MVSAPFFMVSAPFFMVSAPFFVVSAPFFMVSAPFFMVNAPFFVVNAPLLKVKAPLGELHRVSARLKAPISGAPTARHISAQGERNRVAAGASPWNARPKTFSPPNTHRLAAAATSSRGRKSMEEARSRGRKPVERQAQDPLPTQQPPPCGGGYE